MKILRCLLGLIFIFSCSAMAGPIILKQGETFTYEFENLPFIEVGTYWSSNPWEHSAELFWDVKSLKKGTQMKVTLFEDSVNDTPLIENIWTSPALGGGFTLGDPTFLNVWQDLQGVFSFTALSGSLMINSFVIKTLDTIDSEFMNVHSLSVSPVSVSEPGSAGLLVIFAAGLCIIALARRRGFANQ
ncbi:MAG: hypothetical protein V4660_13390 [Pseudomonadota bacterium]